jgi:hypothetical protein
LAQMGKQACHDREAPALESSPAKSSGEIGLSEARGSGNSGRGQANFEPGLCKSAFRRWNESFPAMASPTTPCDSMGEWRDMVELIFALLSADAGTGLPCSKHLASAPAQGKLINVPRSPSKPRAPMLEPARAGERKCEIIEEGRDTIAAGQVESRSLRLVSNHRRG